MARGVWGVCPSTFFSTPDARYETPGTGFYRRMYEYNKIPTAI